MSLGFSGLVCGVAIAQSAPPLPKNPTPGQQQQNPPERVTTVPESTPKNSAQQNATGDEADQEPITTFRTGTSLVNLYFVARDKQHNLIPTLTQNDCTVSQDKTQQTIKSFTANANQPLTLGVLIDTSGSQLRVLPMEQQAGGAFLDHILRRGKDEAFLVSFDVQVELLVDYTDDANKLKRAMNKTEINTGGGHSTGIAGLGQGTIPDIGKPKGTLLYDAVYLAGHDELKSETGRKALILLTDGEDEGSRETIRDAEEAAQRADAVVYVLLLADPGAYGSIGYNGAGAMQKLTEATGGRVINVGMNGKKLAAAFDQIEAELRTQYQITYAPDKPADNAYHSVNIECKGDGIKVQSRKGYYALATE